MCQKTLSDTIQQLVVNDYFTPSIKAEVILDTLLTPYVAEIVNNQCRLKTNLVAKEMSIPEDDHFGSNAPKIDYVLADWEAVYLVELKTTDSSIKNAQAEYYHNNCRGKLFGERLGRQLLTLLYEPENMFTLDLGDPSSWNDEMMRTAFQTIIAKSFDLFHFPSDMKINEGGYTKKAQELIYKNKWTQKDKYRSRKYLYTLGQLMDYMYPDKGGPRPLWGLPLKLLYITPTGILPHKKFESNENFYLRPEGKDSVSLVEASRYLSGKSGDGLAQLLTGIIKEIYKTEEDKCQN